MALYLFGHIFNFLKEVDNFYTVMQIFDKWYNYFMSHIDYQQKLF